LGQTWSRQSLEERGGVRNPGLPRAEQGEQVLQSATEAASRDLALLLQRRLALMARSTAVSGAGLGQAAEQGCERRGRYAAAGSLGATGAENCPRRRLGRDCQHSSQERAAERVQLAQQLFLLRLQRARFGLNPGAERARIR